MCKGPGAGLPGVLEEQQGNCVSGAESKGEEREEVRAGRGQGQVVQDIMDPVEDLGFYSQEGGSNGGLWAEEGWDLTQVGG